MHDIVLSVIGALFIVFKVVSFITGIVKLKHFVVTERDAIVASHVLEDHGINLKFCSKDKCATLS